MKKIFTVTQDLSIESGSSSTSAKVDLQAGEIKRVAIYPTGTPSQEVDVFIKDTQTRDELVPATNYRAWLDGNGGNYYERKKPVQIKGGRSITVHATSTVEQTTDFKFQIVFEMEYTPES